MFKHTEAANQYNKIEVQKIHGWGSISQLPLGFVFQGYAKIMKTFLFYKAASKFLTLFPSAFQSRCKQPSLRTLKDPFIFFHLRLGMLGAEVGLNFILFIVLLIYWLGYTEVINLYFVRYLSKTHMVKPESLKLYLNKKCLTNLKVHKNNILRGNNWILSNHKCLLLVLGFQQYISSKSLYISEMAPNINRLNLVCWHNWIYRPPAAEFTSLSSHKSSLIGCYGRITNITWPKCTKLQIVAHTVLFVRRFIILDERSLSTLSLNLIQFNFVYFPFLS